MISAIAAAGLSALAIGLVGSAVHAEEHVRVTRPLVVGRARARTARRMPRTAVLLIAALAAAVLCHPLAGLAGSVGAAALVLAAPTFVRRRRARRTERAIQDQLAEAVSLIASGMRSGRSLLQAIELAAEEVRPPLAPSLRRMVDRTALGDPPDEAIGAWAAEVASPDARLVAGVLHLHRRTGGALAVTLDDLAATLRARRSAARELQSLTAQARLSAAILGLLPVGFFLFLSVVAREDLRAAYETRLGAAAIGLGLVLQALAYLWIRHLLRIEA